MKSSYEVAACIVAVFVFASQACAQPVYQSGNTIQIEGTVGADTVLIGGDVNVVAVLFNNVSYGPFYAPLGENLRIYAELDTGNDYFDYSDRGNVSSINHPAMEIYGEGGTDSIKTGDAVDTVNGGDGTDIIQTFGGIDTIWGGAGGDTIYSGDLGDTVDGGSGTDTLYQGGSSDYYVTGVEHIY